ncbi:TonB-dependent receptor [Corallincola luteus]|uniref:TonB-dependent receptor n=1 Tax=Corallincola luteus TaxID=1775177 RepID=A0ABY2AJM1_9GAMM|nr:TonB-dependent receptor [Corallincola luteus]TCI01553.1 TonB-dependent receptor [Corallincola luteus]
MYTSSKLAKAVRLAMIGGAFASAATAVPAYAADEEEVERIEVTGSRIKRTDFEGANPVTVLDRSAIMASGKTDVGSLLQSQTFSAGIANNTSVNNGGGGGVYFSLRGLGEDRTLVLLNGRRVVYSGLGADAGVDLNNIPTAVVERIEVLKDGASATYGSDAIGGVVNIITRKDFEGVEFEAYYGETDENDGEKKKVDIVIGTSSDKGNVTIAAGYYEQEEVMMGDRGYSEFETWAFGNDDGNGFWTMPGGSSAPPWSNVDGYKFHATNADDPRDPSGELLYLDADGKQTTVNTGTPYITDINQTLGPDYAGWKDFSFGGGDAYNYNPVNYLSTPSERYYVNMEGNYELGSLSFGDTTIFEDIVAFSEGSYTNRQSERLIAAEPLAPLAFFDYGDATYSADNYYNRMFGPKDADGNSYDIADWRRRTVEAGGRSTSHETDTFRTVLGIKGLFTNGWGWELSYNYGKSTADTYDTGYYNLDRVAEAVGDTAWVDSDGAIVPEGTEGASLACADADGAVIGGCVPLNIFGEGSIDQAVLDYISTPYNTLSDGYNEQSIVQFLIDGEAFELPYGTVGFAAGMEHREEEGGQTYDALVLGGTTTAGESQNTNGAYRVDEMFVEFNIPLLDGVTGAELLEMDVAYRYFDYNTFGSDDTYKVGLRWKPIEDVMLRGTISEAFRAPNVSDLYAGEFITFPTAADPCVDPAASAAANGLTEAEVSANCVASGAPGGGYDNGGNTQVRTLEGGYSELEPETADIYTIGLVYEPEFVEGLAITLDYWNIELDNAISQIGTQTTMDQCALAGDLEACDRIVRRADGNISQVENLNTNVGSVKTDGIDFEIRYNMDPTEYGDFIFTVGGTQLRSYDKTLSDGSTIAHKGRHEQDNDGFFAEWRVNTTLDWSYDDYSANWQMRYISGIDEKVEDGTAIFGDGAYDFERSTSSNIVHDAQFNWAFLDNATWTLGVNNVFDRDPETVYSGFNANTVTEAYDVVGRFFYSSVNFKF